jgi:hypothetical protein
MKTIRVPIYPRTLKVAQAIQKRSLIPVSLTFLINDAACYQLEKHSSTKTKKHITK